MEWYHWYIVIYVVSVILGIYQSAIYEKHIDGYTILACVLLSTLLWPFIIGFWVEDHLYPYICRQLRKKIYVRN